MGKLKWVMNRRNDGNVVISVPTDRKAPARQLLKIDGHPDFQDMSVQSVRDAVGNAEFIRMFDFRFATRCENGSLAGSNHGHFHPTRLKSSRQTFSGTDFLYQETVGQNRAELLMSRP